MPDTQEANTLRRRTRRLARALADLLWTPFLRQTAHSRRHFDVGWPTSLALIVVALLNSLIVYGVVLRHQYLVLEKNLRESSPMEAVLISDSRDASPFQGVADAANGRVCSENASAVAQQLRIQRWFESLGMEDAAATLGAELAKCETDSAGEDYAWLLEGLLEAYGMDDESLRTSKGSFVTLPTIAHLLSRMKHNDCGVEATPVANTPAAGDCHQRAAWIGCLSSDLSLALANTPLASFGRRGAAEAYVLPPDGDRAKLCSDTEWRDSGAFRFLTFSEPNGGALDTESILKAALLQLELLDPLGQDSTIPDEAAVETTRQFMVRALSQLQSSRSVKQARANTVRFRGYEWLAILFLSALALHILAVRFLISRSEKRYASSVLKEIDRADDLQVRRDILRRDHTTSTAPLTEPGSAFEEATSRPGQASDLAAYIIKVASNLLADGRNRRPTKAQAFAATSTFRDLCEQERSLLHQSRLPVRLLIVVLPAIGFIGTVRGIMAALGSSDTIVAATTQQGQQEAVATVAATLSIAFATTLYALLANLLLKPLSDLQERVEFDIIDRLEEGLAGVIDEALAAPLNEDGAAATEAGGGEA